MRKFYNFIPMLVGVLLFLGNPLISFGQTLKSTQDFTALPVSENWDVDQDPDGWTYFTNSSEGTVTVQSTTYNSPSYAVDMSNSTDESSDFILVTPAATFEANGSRIKFWAKGTTTVLNSQSFKVGFMTDPSDPATYTNLHNGPDLTTDWQEFIVDVSMIPPQGGSPYYIAIQGVFDGTNKHIYIDDFVWEEIPTGPILTYNPTEIDYGMVFLGETSGAETVTLSNYGINTLDVTDITITGTDAADFYYDNLSGTLPFGLTANSANNLTFDVYFEPQTEAAGAKSASLDITHSEGTTSIPLTGECPEGLIQIGYGTEENTHLPMEPFYGYSYSQSLYLQSEIDVAGQRISRVYYQKNNSNEWPDAGQINIYMGHTTQTSLTDWIPVTELQEVTYSEALPVGDDDGWVEFILITPFIYNNTDNLVIAFDENKSSYDSSSDEFYNHTVAEDMSIYYYNDGTNPDPAIPPAGTLMQVRPNIRLYFEDLPMVPVFSVNPESHDYGTIVVYNTADEDFTIRNNGIGTLTINDIYLGGDDATEFALSNLPTFPLDLTNDPADFHTLTCNYNPTFDGDVLAYIYFDTSEGLDSVELIGNGYDATIATLPWEEGFDDPATTTVPEITLGWSTILNASSTYAAIRTEAASAISSPNSVEYYNSDDLTGDYFLITPPCTIDPTEVKVLFSANGEINDTVVVGVMTDATDIATFTPIEEFALTGSYEEFELYIASAGVSAPYFVAFKGVFSNTYNYINIDDVKMQDVPVDPTPEVLPEVWNAGQRPVDYTAVSGTYTLENIGTSPLTVSAITDLSGTMFTTSFVAGDVVDLPLGGTYEFTFEFTPTVEGTYEETFVIESNGVNDTVMLYGTCDYSLPSNVIEIGWQNDTIDLPFEPVAVYSYSQTVYKQSELDMTDQAIYSLYYHQNSATVMTEDIKVYMAHYTGENLDAGWQTLGNLVQVYDGALSAPNAEGWVKVTLDIPFIYNNTDNLIIAFDENGAASFADTDGFYGSVTEENLSRLNTNDFTNIDPASISGGTVLAQRPNIRIEFGPLPTDPIWDLNLTSWDAGMIPGNQVATSGDIFRISNLGAGTQTVTDAVLLDGSVFSTSLVAGDVNLASGEEYYFSFDFAPLAVGTYNDTLVITHDGVTDTIFLSGYTDYVLPENMVEVGQGTLTSSLPIEPYYGYTYSQSIYLQTELNMEGMRISKVLYQKNNANDWANNGEIRIYMGHTTQESLTDWIPLAELQEVTYEEVLPAGDGENWVEFVLNTPFIYNNTDNLVIAVDENTGGYATYNDDFYTHSVATDMSIRYYNDGTNPDPASPPTGTLVAARPNTRLQFEEMPTTPVFAVTPESHDFGISIINTTASKGFTVQNNGINTLTINDIYLGGDEASEFTLQDLPTFPVGLTNDIADAFTLNAEYNPSIEGPISAKIYFDHSEGLDSVMLYAEGYDATIYTLPYNEYFDDPATTIYPNITLGWNVILESTDTYASAGLIDYSYVTEPHCVRFYNSGDTDVASNYMLVTPPTQIDPLGTRLRFFANGDAGDQLIIGYMTDNNDPTTFVEVETIDLEADYTQHTVDMSSVVALGFYNIAFKATFGGTYHYIYIDNVTWETTPTTPVFEAMPTEIDFGDVEMLTTAGPETVEVRNVGVGELIITDVQVIGAEADQFSINVIDALNDTITPDYSDFLTVEASFSPAYAGIITADIQFTDVDANTYTVPLIGNSIDPIMTPDTLIDFEDAVPPLFWGKYSGLLSEGMTLTETTSGWFADDFSNDATNYTQAATINIWTTTTNYWMVTSPIELGDGSTPVMLEFDLSATPYGTSDEAEDAPDDRFAVVISTDNGATWEMANVLRLWDNEGSEYVYDDIPNGDGMHVEISLSDYSGLVRIGLYGESTESNADNNVFVDDLIIRNFTLEEIALLDAVNNTSIIAAPELTTYEETNTDEHAIDFTVDFPTPFDANLNALLLHDFMVEFNSAIPTGTTIDVEFDGSNIGQFVADGTASSFWISDVAAAVNPALSTKIDEVITLKVNGLTAVGTYEITFSSYTALDGEFDMATERTLLADALATINVTPTPVGLPIEEDFDAGIPANWHTYNNGTDGADWVYTTDAALGSTTGANGYMRVNDGAVTGLTNADLVTLPIDMSGVSGTILLDFEHFYDDISLSKATVFISTDSGTTWEEVEEFTSDEGTMDEPVLASLDITSFAAGEPNVIIRWNFDDHALDALSWNIDDVHIYEYVPSTEAEIIAFDIAGEVSSNIDAAMQTVDIVMPYGTDLSALIPVFTLSDGAVASITGTEQVSGTTPVDFTNSATTAVVYTVTAEDGTTYKDWDVSVSTETSIADAGEFNFAVYPNPSNGQFDLNVYSESGFTYSIYAADGKLIQEASVDASGEYLETINMKGIAPGVYTLKVKADDSLKIEKLIIK